MREYILLLLSTVLVNNVVLVKFLGLCPFMGISKKTVTAISMGLATTFVMTMALASCWMLEHWLLVPLGMTYLRILVYILVIAVVVQFTEMVVRKTNPALYQVLGIYLPLITTNCAVLGIPLLTTQEKLPFVRRDRPGVHASWRTPPAFAGAPIGFITASLLALTFMGFAGLV